MKTIKVGVIGYGYWGPNLARNFFDLPSAELVAIADLREDRLRHARSYYPEVRTTTNYDDLLNMDLDAVIISVPPALHYPIAKKCLQNGLHTLIEKPMTQSGEHAEELILLAETKNLVLMVGHTFVYNSAVIALKRFIDSGELGDIYYIDTARLNLGLFQRNSSVIWDLAPHDISILLYLLGQDPVSISAYGASSIFDGVFDVAYLNLIFPNQIPAHIHVSWLDPCKVRRITVVGSKKMIVFNDMEVEQKLKIYDKGVDTPEYTDSFGEFHCNYRSGDILIPKVRIAEPLRQECQHFVDSIINKTRPDSDGYSGLKVVKIIEAAESSLKNHSTKETFAWEPLNMPALRQM